MARRDCQWCIIAELYFEILERSTSNVLLDPMIPWPLANVHDIFDKPFRLTFQALSASGLAPTEILGSLNHFHYLPSYTQAQDTHFFATSLFPSYSFPLLVTQSTIPTEDQKEDGTRNST